MNKLQQAAEDYASSLDTNTEDETWYARKSFLAGTEYANGSFSEWCSKNNWIYIDKKQGWLGGSVLNGKSTSELYQLWQQSL